MEFVGKAVYLHGAGGVDCLEIAEHTIAAPGAGEVIVQVAAAGLNRADILQRKGFYPAPAGVPADIPGLEFAGTVVALGDGCDGVTQGDRVMGIVAGGGMASHLRIPANQLLPIPPSMSMEDAAAIPEAFVTAYDALQRQCALHQDHRVLIHACASGVGTAALQVVLHAGAQVVGTSRSEKKLKFCHELAKSMDPARHFHGIDSSEGFSAQAVFTHWPAGCDLILDLVGAKYAKENLRSLASQGVWSVVGLVGGTDAEISLGTLLAKRATMRGTVLRSRSPQEKAVLAQAFSAEVLPSFASGALRPVRSLTLPIEKVAQAHQMLESNEVIGKLVISLE